MRNINKILEKLDLDKSYLDTHKPVLIKTIKETSRQFKQKIKDRIDTLERKSRVCQHSNPELNHNIESLKIECCCPFRNHRIKELQNLLKDDNNEQ